MNKFYLSVTRDNHDYFLIGGFFILVIVLINVMPLNKLGTGYFEAQWLTNYSGGFLRRGLFGQIIAWSGVNPKSLYALFTWLVYLNYLILLGFFLYKVQNAPTLAILIIITTPLLWSFLSQSNGRFDLILNLAFIGIILMRSTIFVVSLFVITPALALIHELWLIFYIPLLGMAMGFNNKWGLLIYCFTLSLAWALALYILTGDSSSSVNFNMLCSSITTNMAELGVTYDCNPISLRTSFQKPGNAIIDSLFGHKEPSPKSFLLNLTNYLLTILYISIAAAPLLYVIHKMIVIDLRFKVFCSGVALLYICMCIIALDYGRFYVLSILLSIVVLFSSDNFTNRKYVDIQGKILLPLLVLSIILFKLPLTRLNII